MCRHRIYILFFHVPKYSNLRKLYSKQFLNSFLRMKTRRWSIPAKNSIYPYLSNDRKKTFSGCDKRQLFPLYFVIVRRSPWSFGYSVTPLLRNHGRLSPLFITSSLLRWIIKNTFIKNELWFFNFHFQQVLI